MENTTDYDVLIIGSGPAGLTAAIYSQRAKLSTAFLEKSVPGGKLPNQSKIENWPGDETIKGSDLALRMFMHATNLGAKYLYGDVKEIISKEDEYKEVIMADGSKLTSKAVIIATGMISNIPSSIKNIEKYDGKGLSYCAICDGPLYANKPMAIIGGGNSAIEEAAYVSNIASHVYIFVRDNHTIAEQSLVDDLKKRNNITLLLNSEIKEINGENGVEKILADVDGQIKEIEVSAIFPYIGFRPSTAFLKELDILDENGFVITNEDMETKIKNVFAIGDVRQKAIRQITTATNDGTIAAKILSNRL
ncbi:NAD(P)/FAD-dependent oxidoreductase [Mycoplasma zalophi]|uniref:FAD-dependent oxidoreductase n=1 Tax=Mycoplasma zalophi TaxID=191287 RepID=A0ABS6DQB1_9MOLU|nr:FAD-dependent oxidoreductase [Mycoplasma zalophi]MBU4691274.1 FAD-dependent oxidoreductase [Mycoplasma zalophi]MBU4692520.1 FAD-dependent oxidoreductase [Mycoplasma zalophi]